MMQILSFSPQLVGTLPPFGIEPSFPPDPWLQGLHLDSWETRGACPAVVISLEGCNTSLHPGNQIGEASTLVVCSWGVLSSSRPPQQGLFLLWQPLQFGVGETGRPLSRMVLLRLVLQESFQWGYTIQDGIIKGGDIMFHHFPQHQDVPCQKAWLAQGRQVGLLCPELEGLHIGHCFLQPVPV